MDSDGSLYGVSPSIAAFREAERGKRREAGLRDQEHQGGVRIAAYRFVGMVHAQEVLWLDESHRLTAMT